MSNSSSGLRSPNAPTFCYLICRVLQALLLRHAVLCTHCTQGGVALLGGTATQAPFGKVGHMSMHAQQIKQANQGKRKVLVHALSDFLSVCHAVAITLPCSAEVLKFQHVFLVLFKKNQNLRLSDWLQSPGHLSRMSQWQGDALHP